MISKLENDKILIKADSLGAELKKLVLKKNNKDYLWHGDSKYWGRSAPVLFPFVGRLKADKYVYNNQEYKMTQHGFARDKEFELIDQGENHLTFSLTEDKASLKKYPFKFRLEIKYKIKGNSLAVSYKVRNCDQKKMFFSIGAHPAFYWPLNKNETKEDYYLEFKKTETASRYLLESGLLNNKKEKLMEKSKKLDLKADTFKDDALVFKDIKSEKIILKSRKTEAKVEMEFEGFPYLGIWSQSAAAPFICLEPWHGIADSVDSSGKLEEKEGIMSLEAGNNFESTYVIKID
jgi:galactose mutarotase-like enzyme